MRGGAVLGHMSGHRYQYGGHIKWCRTKTSMACYNVDTMFKYIQFHSALCRSGFVIINKHRRRRRPAQPREAVPVPV